MYTYKLLTFSISNFMATYFNCYLCIRADQKVAFISINFQVNKHFEASSSDAIKISTSLAVANSVLLSAQFAVSVLFTMKNKSATKMLHKSGPGIDA